MARRSATANPFLNTSSGNARRVRTKTGNGTVQPGYSLLGTGKSKATNRVASTRIKKVVSPLGGQAPAKVGAGGRYANMNDRVVNAQVKVVNHRPKANTGSNVVRPPRTAVRIMDGKGQGKVRNV